MSATKEASKLKNQDFRAYEMYLPTFPEPIDNEIPCEDFLLASRQVVRILDYFGKIFVAVKYDMQGNIDKLTKVFNNDKKNYSTLQKMILEEKSMRSRYATDALLWLRRALHMIQLFFEYVVHDFESGKGSDDLVACLNKAYERTLEPYHGYMAQQLFSLLSRMTPTRSQILRAISNGYDVKQEIAIRCMDRFSKRLRENIINIKTFYEENYLESTYKV